MICLAETVDFERSELFMSCLFSLKRKTLLNMPSGYTPLKFFISGLGLTRLLTWSSSFERPA